MIFSIANKGRDAARIVADGNNQRESTLSTAMLKEIKL